VELCAKIFQSMRNDFKDYAHIFLLIMRTLCAPLSALYYAHLAFSIDNATFLVYITNFHQRQQQLRRDVTVRLVTAFALPALTTGTSSLSVS